MARTKSYQVKQVSKITGVSVRTLHYYDEIGLLKPTDRSAAGYRLYSQDDVLRLQQVLIGRSLGLALEEIRLSLDDPAFDYAQSLRQQRALLVDRLGNTHRMIAAIDTALTWLGEKTSSMDLRTLFDGFDPTRYEEEVQNRWGKADAYEESARRTKTYSDADWTLLKSELDAIWSDAANAMRGDAAPDSYIALEIVERHRAHVCRWFYDLTPEGHAGLADMWLADPRFRENIDKFGNGLTDWLATAVKASAEAV
ncbi:MAG: MerR family transcriptional regulator [Pseudomonadota bacterium]